ncbi:carbon-nitrogen hydrolase family protein [Ferruginivarius sediminum]|uniref:Carbon-nitrogen hydrolase family protein n=2 Tax=Ferruginivarius sediminum TaxID=2661937 RepID=A0A369T9Z5_9PROT|nr:carbon-nitrogen hydrolase family protein [Ferruginivarius sediminum]
MTSGREIAPNLEAAEAYIREASKAGADFVLTPENTPILEPRHDRLKAAVPGEDGHPALETFARLARELDIWLLLGSTAVQAEGDERLANRSYLFAPDGSVKARYDKIHMFDVNVPDGQTYRESATFRPGEQAVLTELPWGGLGMTICYDVRFAALYRQLAQAGASIITVPAAFTQFTGQAHWHTLLRARAIETGCFVLAPAQCGEHAEERRTYGHSLVVAPWGEVLADGGEAPGVTLAELDTARIDDARAWVPALQHDRGFTAPQPLKQREPEEA